MPSKRIQTKPAGEKLDGIEVDDFTPGPCAVRLRACSRSAAFSQRSPASPSWALQHRRCGGSAGDPKTIHTWALHLGSSQAAKPVAKWGLHSECHARVVCGTLWEGRDCEVPPQQQVPLDGAVATAHPGNPARLVPWAESGGLKREQDKSTRLFDLWQAGRSRVPAVRGQWRKERKPEALCAIMCTLALTLWTRYFQAVLPGSLEPP